jgi:hypothetical protein
MPRVDEDVFGERRAARIFLAATVSEARRVERVLDQLGVDYFVRVEPCGMTLFGSTRQGAAFFVDASSTDSCEQALVQAGLGAGIVRDRRDDEISREGP